MLGLVVTLLAVLFTSSFPLLLIRVGDITKLSLEAIIHPTNESLTDKNPISNCILEGAGPELRDELKTQVVCK